MPGAHTRCPTIENELRDDLAQSRKTLYLRDREIASLKKQVLSLKAELQRARVHQPFSHRLRGCLLRIGRVLCPCCVRPTAAQAVWREHTQRLREDEASSDATAHRQAEGAGASSDDLELAEPPYGGSCETTPA